MRLSGKCDALFWQTNPLCSQAPYAAFGMATDFGCNPAFARA
jgi:hypothetical protein